MAKCPECNKFAAYSEEPEIDIDNAEFCDGMVTGSATVRLTSECCGADIKEGTIDFEIEVVHPNCEDCSECDIEVEDYIIDNCTSERRKSKLLFSADVEVTLKCPCNKQDSWTVTSKIEVQPSELDDCY